MNLKALKRAMDAAEAKLSGAPDDEDLKSEYSAAKSAYEAALAESEDDEDENDGASASGKQGDKGGQSDDGDDEQDLDESGLDDKAKAYIKKLRKENAKYRNKSKAFEDRLTKIESGLKNVFGEEEDDVPAEQKLEGMTMQTAALTAENAILQSALINGIPAPKLKYYSFLVRERLDALEEGEEIGEEELAEIAAEAMASGGAGKKTTTSVGGGKQPNPDKGKSQVTLDDFVAMSITKKSELYASNPTQYNELMAEAKAKRRL